MRKRNLQNEKLDQIGRKLLETTRVRHDEIEQIVASPQLFDAVKARIKTEQRERKSKNLFGNRLSFTIWNWQSFSVASAVLIILVFGAFSFIVMRQPDQINDQIVQAPEMPIEVAPIEIPQPRQISQDLPELAIKKKPFVKPKIKQAFFEKEKAQPKKAERKQIPAKKPGNIANDPGGEFYALNYVGNPNQTGEALRVVRTELSRSTLFALGVNLPIENESEKIKTDLLVGMDGVARAIRFVE